MSKRTTPAKAAAAKRAAFANQRAQMAQRKGCMPGATPKQKSFERATANAEAAYFGCARHAPWLFV